MMRRWAWRVAAAATAASLALTACGGTSTHTTGGAQPSQKASTAHPNTTGYGPAGSSVGETSASIDTSCTPCFGQVAVDQYGVYLVNANQTVVAYSPNLHTVRWTYGDNTIKPKVAFSEPYGLLVVSAEDQSSNGLNSNPGGTRVALLNPRSGKPTWSNELMMSQNQPGTMPSCAGSQSAVADTSGAVLSCTGGLELFSPTGQSRFVPVAILGPDGQPSKLPINPGTTQQGQFALTANSILIPGMAPLTPSGTPSNKTEYIRVDRNTGATLQPYVLPSLSGQAVYATGNNVAISGTTSTAGYLGSVTTTSSTHIYGPAGDRPITQVPGILLGAADGIFFLGTAPGRPGLEAVAASTGEGAVEQARCQRHLPRVRPRYGSLWQHLGRWGLHDEGVRNQLDDFATRVDKPTTNGSGRRWKQLGCRSRTGCLRRGQHYHTNNCQRGRRTEITPRQPLTPTTGGPWRRDGCRQSSQPRTRPPPPGQPRPRSAPAEHSICR